MDLKISLKLSDILSFEKWMTLDKLDHSLYFANIFYQI